ncbi:hypothetical protein [Amnibacterium kyonggiense]
MTRLRRFIAPIALLTASIGLTGAFVAPSALAATEHSVSVPYDQNWVFRSTKLNRCVFIDVSGSISGQWRYAYTNGDTDDVVWTSIKLNNPTITAEGWPISGAGCDSTRSWSMKADLSQGWYQSSCNLTVSVAASFPWSVSATPGISCDTKRVGHRSTTEGPSTSALHQYNSGAPISFSQVLAKTSAGGVGFRGLIGVTAHTSSASDTVHHTVDVTLNR